MKKISKVLSIILVVMMVLTVITPVFGAAYQEPSVYTGEQDTNVDTSKISNLGQSIIRILTTIGIIASVIVLIVLGIKYMMGSPEEKAEYKKTLMPYIIGAGLVFAASAIAQVVFNFMQDFVA